jgi:DNA invertase Pin-like site-specific DNA recombinase
MQRAAIYARVSTPVQCVENQLYDLREMASRRGYEILQGVHRSRVRLQGGQCSLQQQRGAIPKQGLRWQTA